MGLHGEVSNLYNALVESQNIRPVQYPNTAAGINIVSNGAIAADTYMANYTTIVANLANPVWLVGLSFGLPVVEAFRGTIKIAVGAAGFEVDLEPIDVGINAFPVGDWFFPIYRFPAWHKVLNGIRLAFNIRKDTIASLAGFNNCHVIGYTAVGS